MMKKFSGTCLSLALTFVFLSALALPGSFSADAFHYGYPFSFIAIHANTMLSAGDILLSRFAFEILGFILDVAILYFVFKAISVLIRKARSRGNPESPDKAE